VLTIYRKDGSANTVPVWFRWTDPAFEVVIAEGDVKLRHLARDHGASWLSTTIQARVLLRLIPDSPRIWDLSGILPS
jgi:hypothetical protein